MGLRVAIVGLGAGRSHVKGLIESPAAATVCALCDADPKRLRRIADEFGVAARYGDFERMLAAERPDAVVVATPNDLHEPMTVAALEAGCHVLVEKPLAHTLPSARRIARAAAKHGRLVMLDLSFRFGKAARTVKRFLDSGRCGPLYHASTYWCRTRGIPSWSSWFSDRARAGGGPVIDLGVHRIDLALWFLGDPKVEAISAVTHGELGRALAREPGRAKPPAARKPGRSSARGSGRSFDRGFDVEEFGGGLLRLEGGRALVFEVSWAENSGRREVMLTRVLGVRGGAVHRNLDHTYEFVADLQVDRRGKLVTLESKPFAQPELVPVREFVRAIGSGARDVPDAETGLRLQRVLEGIYRSAARGREVLWKELAE